MADYIENESVCRRCFHSYVCEQFNEHRNSNNEKCHFFNDHFVPAADVVPVVRCKNCVHCEEERTVMGYVPFCLKWIMNTTEDGYCHEGVAISGAKMDRK